MNIKLRSNKLLLGCLLFSTSILNSCTPPEEEVVAKKFCDCNSETLNYLNQSNVKSTMAWYDSLDVLQKTMMTMNASLTDYSDTNGTVLSKEKIEKYKTIKTKIDELEKKLQSCNKAIEDEYGSKMKNEEFN